MTYTILDHYTESNPLIFTLVITRSDWERFEEEPPAYILDVECGVQYFKQAPIPTADNPDDYYGYDQCDLFVHDTSLYQYVEGERGRSLSTQLFDLSVDNLEEAIPDLDIAEVEHDMREHFSKYAETFDLANGDYGVEDFV